MIKITTYSTDTVFNAMNHHGILPDGQKFKHKSSRLVLFKEKGTRCVRCERVGTVFVLETQNVNINPHLNLYAVDADETYILMTKDHIKPLSLDGANTLDNYDTMCSPCNFEKADSFSV